MFLFWDVSAPSFIDLLRQHDFGESIFTQNLELSGKEIILSPALAERDLEIPASKLGASAVSAECGNPPFGNYLPSYLGSVGLVNELA